MEIIGNQNKAYLQLLLIADVITTVKVHYNLGPIMRLLISGTIFIFGRLKSFKIIKSIQEFK